MSTYSENIQIYHIIYQLIITFKVPLEASQIYNKLNNHRIIQFEGENKKTV